MNQQQHFAAVPSVNIPRSSFDRSHGHKTAINADYIYPIYIDEVLPGDTFNMRAGVFGRIATPLEFPIMDNLYLETFWFFVPNRLIWSNFKKFMGERSPNPTSSIDFTFPTVPAPTTTGFALGSLYDYFGLPCGKDGFSVNNYARAYNLIWNEWFRDQNLQDSVTVDLDDGPDDSADYVLLKRGKRHDYFTSCLPYPQKGADDVEISLAGTAPVYSETLQNGVGNAPIFQSISGATVTATYARVGASQELLMNNAASANDSYMALGSPSQYASLGSPYTPPYADLTDASPISINELRTAVALQQFLEIDARGGTRYVESNLAHFGVVSSDQRMQRPELLSLSSSRIGINTVPQTSGTASPATGNALAGVAAFGTMSAQASFVRSFEEHGIVIGLACIRADLNYQQGINKMWTRSTREDFYWPALHSIGEQAVLKKEIFYSDVPATDEAVFGYQERYGEYRYKPSIITGIMNSDAASSLDSWHLAQDFSAAPALNASFIVQDTPMSRAVAVSSSYHFLVDCDFKLNCARPMKVYSVPGLDKL